MVNETKEANIQEQINNSMELIIAWKGKGMINRNCINENLGGVTKLIL